MDEAARLRLSDWLEALFSCPVRITDVQPLTGGAIQENWQVEADVGGATRAFVLRKDARSTITASHGRADEFALIKAAHEAGVTVPEPIGFCADRTVLGGPFAVMARMPGVGLGPKVVKELADDARHKLTERLARELARIHAIAPPRDDLDFLGEPPEDFAREEIYRLREWLDELDLVRPGLEWALRWCEIHIPGRREAVLIHRDFRTGNYMVENGHLTAILDWEFACWGDPMFDVGWFHAECWRFSRPDLEAGGIGDRETFYTAYADESGRRVDDAAVRAYEVLAHCRWAVIALQQGDRHASGREPSIAHALTGRIAEELELMALRLTAPNNWRRAG